MHHNLLAEPERNRWRLHLLRVSTRAVLNKNQHVKPLRDALGLARSWALSLRGRGSVQVLAYGGLGFGLQI